MAVLLGRTSAGTTADFNAAGGTAVWKFTAVQSGKLEFIKAQTKVSNPTAAPIRLGIYDDVSGTPTNRLGVGEVDLATGRGTGVFQAKISPAVNIVAGTVYWIGWYSDVEQWDFQGNTGALGDYKETAGFANFPTTMGGTNDGAVGAIIWGESMPPNGDALIFWTEQGPDASFGPDPFHPYDAYLVPDTSGAQTSVQVGLGSAQQFGAITAVPGGVSTTMTGLGSAQQFGKVSLKFGVQGIGSAQQFGQVSVKYGVPALNTAQSFGSVTVVTGGVGVPMAGLGSAQQFGKVSLKFGVGGLGSAQQFGLVSLKFQVPSLQSGASFGIPQENIALTVGGLSSAQAFGAPSVSTSGGGQAVSATGLASAQAFGTPTPSPGGVVKIMTGLGTAQQFGSVQGNQIEHPAGLTSAQSFGSVTIATGGVTKTVNGVPSAQSFGSPSVTTPGAATFDPAVQGWRRRGFSQTRRIR